MKKKKSCFDCKEEFEYDTLAKFQRKYCKKCSDKRKKMLNDQWKVKFEDMSDD